MFMFSLAGVPPFFGFWPKFLVFRAAVQAWPEVVECAALTGDMDYLLRVVVEDMSHYSRFIMETLGGEWHFASPPSASAGANAIACRIPSSAFQRASMSVATAAMWSGSLTSSSSTSGGCGSRLAIRVVIRIPRPKPVSTICAPSCCAQRAR